MAVTMSSFNVNLTHGTEMDADTTISKFEFGSHTIVGSFPYVNGSSITATCIGDINSLIAFTAIGPIS